MSFEILLQKFGYAAVFFGTFLEGEGILVLAGFFAQQHYLSLVTVILTAFLGSYSGHLFWFWLGRRHGVKLLERFPKMKRHFGKGLRLFERYGALTIFISQYLYGLRIAGAVIVGISKIRMIKFLIYQAISCFIWSIVIASLGFYFGEAVERFMGRAGAVQKYALGAIVVIMLIVFLVHRIRERREATQTGR